jgi:hypothetical protein
MPPNSRSNPGLSSGPPRYPGSFLLAFKEALAGLQWEARRWLGDAVACADVEGEEHIVGLENLYRRARREERAHWPALITDFLARIREAERAGAAGVELANVVDRLLVRFGPAFTNRGNQAPVWWRPLDGTDLGLNLVIDQPDTMVYVTEEMVTASGKPGDEWLGHAQANLRARTPPDCLEVIHEESGLRLCSVGDAYDSSRAVLLEELLPEASAAGLLTAIPSRDELLVLPVAVQALPHVHLLKLLAEKNFQKAPYAISDQVYWVRTGVWRTFSIEIRKDEVAIQPPPEFVEILNSLAPQDEKDSGADPTEE